MKIEDFAEMLDNRGSITLTKLARTKEPIKKGRTNWNYPIWIPRIHLIVSQKEGEEILKLLGVGFLSTGTNNKTRSYVAHNQAAGVVLEKIYPYLINREREAEIVIEACRLNARGKNRQIVASNENSAIFFDSLKEAAEFLGTSSSLIHLTASGKQKTTRGWKIAYRSDEQNFIKNHKKLEQLKEELIEIKSKKINNLYIDSRRN